MFVFVFNIEVPSSFLEGVGDAALLAEEVLARLFITVIVDISNIYDIVAQFTFQFSFFTAVCFYPVNRF